MVVLFRLKLKFLKSIPPSVLIQSSKLFIFIFLTFIRSPSKIIELIGSLKILSLGGAQS